MCVLGDVQIANSNKSLKHKVFRNLFTGKMRAPLLGPFTDRNDRLLYVQLYTSIYCNPILYC